jgi:prolyl 4-hydroxylase
MSLTKFERVVHMTLPRIATLARRPRVRQIEGFLSISDCEALRKLASGKMGACELLADAECSHERSSTGCWLPRYDSPRSAWRDIGASEADIALMGHVEFSLANACGYPASHGEPAQILRYRVGQQYMPHPDFFDPLDREALANGGQRLLTCLVYLTTLPASCGGATWFTTGLRVQPVAGRALIWHNCRVDGAVDPNSVHAGELVSRPKAGEEAREKWVLSKWVRQRPFEVDHSAFRIEPQGPGHVSEPTGPWASPLEPLKR